MSKVIVTGQGLGKDFGVCGTCNLDFTWLALNPSVLVWAEKILITHTAWESQISSKNSKYDKAINLVLEIANTNGLIELIKPNDVFKDEISSGVCESAEKDMLLLMEKFPQNVKYHDNDYTINGIMYCIPYVSSIYASIKLGEALDANCLFNNRAYEYLKYLYGLYTDNTVGKDRVDTLNEIFELFLPDETVLHHFMYENDKCNTCEREKECRKTYLHEIEKRVKKLLEWRDYDEIHRAKEEIEKIIKHKQFINGEITVEEVKKEFEDKQKIVNRKLKKVFPVVKRWTSLTTIAATSLTLCSAVMGNPEITITGASMLGVSRVVDETIKYYENKHKWVGFINKEKKNN